MSEGGEIRCCQNLVNFSNFGLTKGSVPLTVKFRSQNTVQDILSKAWKLAKTEEYKKIWIRKDMNKKRKKEPAGLNVLFKEAKEKN